MASIGIAFTDSGSTVHNVVISSFAQGDFPRQYLASGGFSNSANGALIVDGPAYRQKYFWTIAAIIPSADALAIDAMFQAWDADRAGGLPVACGITDQTFGPTVSTSAVFSTPPTFTYQGGNVTLVSLGLTEV